MGKTDIKEFMKLAVERIQRRLGSVSVRSDDVIKNNGIVNHSITIVSKQSNISPCIYVDRLYAQYNKEEKSLDDVINEIISIYEDNKVKCDFDVSRFTDYEKVKPLLQGRLVNTESNKAILSNMPHREFLDLSVIYVVEIEGYENCIGSIKVTNEHMKLWNVSEEILYQQAMQNMILANDGYVVSMAEMLKQQLGEEADMIISEDEMLYVIGNKKGTYGAIEILNENLLKTFADQIESDFLIIPSSVHECLLMSILDKNMDLTFVSDMVRDVNNTVVSKEDILSYCVYKYQRSTGRVTLAA